ncbi:hypothetical protein [Enterobacter sp.]|uniref:hypothetical protein n=1 Tax=Enterobacter sp. TaxID=42895 RepID=UPI00296EEB55|nr:hypothetical protein [Enterobacter sp.]
MSNFLFDYVNNNKIKNILGVYGKNKGKGNFGKIKALKNLSIETLSLNEDKIQGFARACYKNVAMRNLLNLSGFNKKTYLDLVKEQNLPTEFILEILKAFITENKFQLKTFVLMKNKIEEHFLRSEFPQALILLKKIEETFGKSIWSIDVEMAIASTQKKTANKEIFVDDSSPQLYHITNYLYSKHTSHSALSFKQKSKVNIIDSIRKNGNRKNYADFLSLLLLPFSMDNIRCLDNVIQYSQKLYPIDKYVFIRKAISEHVATKISSNSPIEDNVKLFVSSLAELDFDESWEGMNSVINNQASTNTDVDVQEIITAYTEGDYSAVISKCKKYFELNPRQLILIDVLARSIIFSNRQKEYFDSINANDTYGVLLTNLIKQYLHTEQYQASIEVVEDISFKLSCFNFTSAISAPFYISYPYQNTDKLKTAILDVICNGLVITPKFLKHISIEKVNSFNFDALLNVPRLTKSRDIRNQLFEHTNDFECSKSYTIALINELRKESDITIPDFFFYESTSLLKIKAYNDLVTIINTKAFEKRSNLILFPMQQLAKIVDDNVDNLSNSLEAAIFCHFYQKQYDKSYIDVTSFFIDEYLSKLAFNKPSDLLLEGRSLNDNEQFLLTDVCDERVLSGLENISDTVIMLTERLKIIDLLFEKERKDLLSNEMVDNLSKEEVGIYQKLLVSRLTNHHAQNKINIDFSGMLAVKDDYYHSAFETMKRIKNDEFSIYLDYFLSTQQEDGNDIGEKTSEETIKAKSYHYSLLYSNLIDDFIMNNEFGLVRYLSSEIRHGVLPNHIRSVFEAEHLVTSKVSDKDIRSSYEPPYYWLNEMKTLDQSELIQLNDYLIDFSASIDALIQTTNNLIRPTTIPDMREYKEAKTPDTAFLFQISDKQINFFSVYIDSYLSKYNTSSEMEYKHFIEVIKDFIWLVLETSFHLVRRFSNEAIKPAFAKTCDDLIAKICKIPSVTSESNIIKRITLAKYNVNEKLSDFEEWFRKPAHELDEDVEIGAILQASKEYIEGIYTPQKIDIIFDIQKDLSWVMSNNSLLYLTRSLVTMYMNCLKHGINKSATQIYVSVTSDENGNVIKVCNQISESQSTDLSSLGIIKLVESFQNHTDNVKLTKEGGTGLYKVYKNISDAFPHALFYLELEENLFKQIIQFKKVSNENPNN